ncbi:DUF1828 domain-containing protein [Mesorhizobium sp. ORM6]
MKEILCKAFCSTLQSRSVPGGYAIETPYQNSDGDPLLLYYVRSAPAKWRIEDDGTQVALLEANGVDISGRSRGEALATLLTEYGVAFDPEARTLYSPTMPEAELGQASLRFVALLLRLQDLALLSAQVVRNTFREDAITAIRGKFEGIAQIEENAPIAPELSAYTADIRISAAGSSPLAVFLATSEERALQALVLKMEVEKYRQEAIRVILLIEKAKDNPLRESTYALSQVRLDDVLSFRGVETEAMDRLVRDFQQGGQQLH